MKSCLFPISPVETLNAPHIVPTFPTTIPSFVPSISLSFPPDYLQIFPHFSSIRFWNVFQAADIAMKKDMDAAIKSGQVALICIVSDDRGFSETLVWARQNGVKTAVIGNMYSLRVRPFTKTLLYGINGQLMKLNFQ